MGAVRNHIFLDAAPLWALALVLRRQYAAANVPMLPVVVGADRTRRAIVTYTVLMIAVSLVPGSWLGPIYLLGAVALGSGFLILAWRAMRSDEGMIAVTLFHYSLIYLALLFTAAALAAVVHV